MPIWSMWEEICPFFNFCRKHFWSIEKSIWLDKKVFHWRVETSLNKDGFYHVLFLARAKNYKNCQLFSFTGDINLSQWRTKDGFYHVLFLARAKNYKNCQLFSFTGDINLSQWRTTYHPPTETMMLQENKNNNYHSIFNF